MKRIGILLFLSLISTIFFINCSKSTISDSVGKSISPVSALQATYDSINKKIDINWKNPDDPSLLKIEISYHPTTSVTDDNPLLIDAKSNQTASYAIHLTAQSNYIINVVAINKAGIRSENTSVEVSVVNDSVPLFLKWADTLMTSVVSLYLEGKPRDIWTSQYPQGGGYWDGAAVVWGQGGAFSGYAALKEAAAKYPSFKSKYENLYDNRLFTSIDKFLTTKGTQDQDTVSAYAVYPENGNERFYDDNIWIGIDMADLYMLTNDTKYIDRSKTVWKFVLSGTDTVLGGGVYWKENTSGKNTCSNMPAVVLAAKLYQATKDQSYLQSAKEIYDWCKSRLEDPTDYLYWDNINYDGNGNISIGKAKFTYNSGQAIEAGALLYNITKEQKYLTDAQNTAASIFKQWGVPFNSYTLNKNFVSIDPDGHVWFRAVMLRGLIELYKIDKNRKYVNAYENLLANAWLSNCRNPNTNLLNYDFRGGTEQTSWEILHEGACIEMIARLAALQGENL